MSEANGGVLVTVKKGTVAVRELACKPVSLFLIVMGVTEVAPGGTTTEMLVPAALALVVTLIAPK